MGGLDELQELKRDARVKAGLSASFESQEFESFGHSPEYYLRASSPQREKEEKKRRKELAEANEHGEGNEKDLHSEDDTKSFARNELLLRPKVRYLMLFVFALFF